MSTLELELYSESDKREGLRKPQATLTFADFASKWAEAVLPLQNLNALLLPEHSAQAPGAQIR